MSRPSIPAEYTKPDFLSPSILKVTVLPLADFFVQLSIISSLPERSQVSSRVCHLTREEFGAVLSVPYYPRQFQSLAMSKRVQRMIRPSCLPVTARASLAPGLARNQGTGTASHLCGACFQPSLLASISLSDCTPFQQFWDRIKKMTRLRKRVSIGANETSKTKQARSADSSVCIGSIFVSSHSG